MKKTRPERRKHCALAVVRRSQRFRPAADPFPGGAGRPKFNQLEMVTTLQTQFGEDRCTQFRVVMVTDLQFFSHVSSNGHGPLTAGVSRRY